MNKNNRINQRRERSLRLEERDKMLHALDCERRDLWSQLREAPLQKLEEPYQKGWERFFVLSEEAKRRKDGEELETALSYIRNYQRSTVNPFVVCRFKSRRFEPWEHYLSGISPRRMLSEKISETILKHFRVRLRDELTRKRIRELIRSGWQGQFYFRYPQYAVSQVQPYMITHARVALPAVERRLAEVEAILRRDENEFRLQRLKDCVRCSWDRLDEAAQDSKAAECARKEIVQAVIDF